MAEFKKENFPGNEINPKPDGEKNVTKVTKGAVHQRQEPLLYRIFGGETAKNIAQYVLWDVIVPAAKSTVADSINNAIDMMFYGEGGGRKSSGRVRRDRGRSYVSYNSIYDNERREPSTRKPRKRGRHRFDEVIIEYRSDAEEVLSTLVELIDQYELCTVKDFYEAVGMASEYTDHKWGWESLGNASIRPVRGGYIIDLPAPRPLE